MVTLAAAAAALFGGARRSKSTPGPPGRCGFGKDPSATRREDGADEADDVVADKREYFHGVDDEDRDHEKAGRLSNAALQYIILVERCHHLFLFQQFSGKGKLEGKARFARNFLESSRGLESGHFLPVMDTCVHHQS